MTKFETTTARASKLSRELVGKTQVLMVDGVVVAGVIQHEVINMKIGGGKSVHSGNSTFAILKTDIVVPSQKSWKNENLVIPTGTKFDLGTYSFCGTVSETKYGYRYGSSIVEGLVTDCKKCLAKI